MKTVTEIFNRAYDRVLQGGYPHLYIAVDVHDTILMKSKTRVIQDGNLYEISLPTAENEYFYYQAKPVLQKFTACDRIKLIMHTSSSPAEITKYQNLFAANNITFDHVNCNPEVVSDVSYADFSQKFFFDILLDDKAGFDPKHDWEELAEWTASRLPHIIEYSTSKLNPILHF